MRFSGSLLRRPRRERREVPNDAPLRSEHEPLSTRGRVAGAVRVSLLGSFRISVGAHVVEESAWQLRKAASLVKLLSLAPAHHLHRGQVMEILWPGRGRQAAAHNLRQALHVARRTLEFNSSTPHYLVSHSEHLVLCPDGLLWVDVEAFEEAAASARRSREPRAYRVAIGLYAGQLLPGDLYEEWAGDRRRELQGLYLALLTELAGLYEESGELEAAVEVLQKVIAEEATREEANAELMRLYALLRRRGEALSQYERLREALRRELGVEPDATTNRLRNEILTGTFKPDHSQPQPHSCREPTDAGKHNLPSVSTNFVGREREMREVELALAMTRFLTLTGVGGSGKTRLALEVARDLVGAYPDGVWLVELAGLSEPSVVPQAVATILGVREQPDQPLLDTLLHALYDKEMLLVLDNCEHLIEDAARLAEALLDSCPRLRTLATSRESLGVTGELSWIVPPLSAPGTQQSPTVEELEGYESARLFANRASNRHPGFELTSENAAAVAQVCARLDGIPLAIELAAARIGMLSAEQVSERLGHSLKLLTGGGRMPERRHQTLRATLDWSYELLSESEQVLFKTISTFVGGFTLEAAESVGTGGGIEEGDVLDLLSMLLDKSMVVAVESWEKGARYRLLEPVRQYAQERLEESGESESARNQHAAFFLALAAKAEPQLKGSGQVEWLERLEEDNDNLRAAMAWLLEEGKVEAAIRMAWALWLYWLIHGHQGEGRRWVEEVLTKGGDLPTSTRARALMVQFTMSYGIGNPEVMKRTCEEAAVLFREAGDRSGLAHALGGLGLATLQQGDAERATVILEESLQLFREDADKWGVSTVLAHLGAIPLSQGDHVLAARYFEEALELTRQIGNMLSGYISLYNLALAAQGQGDYERAAELYEEGLRFAVEAGDKTNTAYCLEGLAELAVASGALERAARLFGAAEALLEDAGGVLYVQAQDRSVRDQAVDALRSEVDETTFSASWTEGAAMTLDEGLVYAISGGESAPPASPAEPRQPPTVNGPVALTRREQEVAVLVACGLTNRQIASELSISEHTVANHVARILRKLDFDSRSQITAWVIQQQTLP